MENKEKYTEQSSVVKTISEDMLESANGGKSEFGIDSRVKGCAPRTATWHCRACGFDNTYNNFTCIRCGAPEPR